MTSSSRNSHWRTRSPLPLLSLPPPQQQAPPALPHPRPTRAPGALAALSPPTAIAAAGTTAVEREVLVATTALEATALPLAPSSSSSRRPTPSSLPPVVAPGPVSTTHGWVPFRCGQGVLVLRWHPSWCLLICRHSSRPSSPKSSRHSLPTSSLLPSLPLIAQDSGSPRGITILWPASLLGTRRPSPPLSLTPPSSNEWYFDTGATSHMTSQSSSLSHVLFPRYPTPSSIIVGNGSILPVTATGSTELPHALRLNNVLAPMP